MPADVSFPNVTAEDGRTSPAEERPRSRQLDGLRALAVILVFLHHADMAQFPGGFLGVDLFFALSGYLITALLLAEFRATQRIALPQFFARRALRLMPALTVMTVVVVFWAHRVRIGSPLKDGVAGLLYWMDLYEPVTRGAGGVFGHTWSLAVEEQFYLLWPLLVLAGLREGWRLPRLVVVLSGCVTTAGAVCALVLHVGSAELYWSPLPHVAELGAGTMLAFVLSCQATAARRALRHPVVPVVALVLLVSGALHLHELRPELYLGGFAIIGVLCAVLVGNLVCAPEGTAGRFLRLPPLAWLGARSYGFYLWHYPILAGVSLHTHDPLPMITIGFPLTLAATVLSWHLVETPFLRLKHRRFRAPTGLVPQDAQALLVPPLG